MFRQVAGHFASKINSMSSSSSNEMEAVGTSLLGLRGIELLGCFRLSVSREVAFGCVGFASGSPP